MNCDHEEVLREMAHNTTGRLWLPTRVTTIEQSLANKTLHRLLEEIPLESEAVTKAAELIFFVDTIRNAA